MTAALPGTLPGLLQPGAPIVHVDEHGHLRHGWVVDRPEGQPLTLDDAYVVLRYDSEVSAILLSRLALDLSRPEGVDRALRWLAERLGLNGRGPLPPTLTRFPHGCGWGWRLASYADGAVRGDSAKLGYGDTDDPIKALRLACLAVGEVSGG